MALRILQLHLRRSVFAWVFVCHRLPMVLSAWRVRACLKSLGDPILYSDRMVLHLLNPIIVEFEL